jgi:uncharacterized protein with FMN-binding domain
LRRAVLTLGGTAAGLAALFSFKTHAAVSDAAVAPQAGQVSAAATPSAPASAGSPLASPASPPSTPSRAATSPAAPPASKASTAPAAKPTTKPAAPATTPAPAKAKPAAGTFTGPDENTQYGAVQVQITTNGSKVTGVNELQQPDDSIGANAITQLDAETLAAGNASIQAVSGATYTSEGYIKSLQSAVDQAGL